MADPTNAAKAVNNIFHKTTYNKYLDRAIRSSKPALQYAGKGIAGGMRYFDNMLGLSATKLRTRATALEHANKVAPNNPNLQRLMGKYQSRAQTAEQAASKTRKLTAGVVAGGLAVNAVANAQRNSQDATATDPYYSYGNPYGQY